MNTIQKFSHNNTKEPTDLEIRTIQGYTKCYVYKCTDTAHTHYRLMVDAAYIDCYIQCDGYCAYQICSLV